MGDFPATHSLQLPSVMNRQYVGTVLSPLTSRMNYENYKNNIILKQYPYTDIRQKTYTAQIPGAESWSGGRHTIHPS